MIFLLQSEMNKNSTKKEKKTIIRSLSPNFFVSAQVHHMVLPLEIAQFVCTLNLASKRPFGIFTWLFPRNSLWFSKLWLTWMCLSKSARQHFLIKAGYLQIAKSVRLVPPPPRPPPSLVGPWVANQKLWITIKHRILGFFVRTDHCSNCKLQKLLVALNDTKLSIPTE